MTERRALWLIYTGSLLVEVGAVLGLTALGANESTVFLVGVFAPLAACSYLVSVVTMHYGPSGKRRRDR